MNDAVSNPRPPVRIAIPKDSPITAVRSSGRIAGHADSGAWPLPQQIFSIGPAQNSPSGNWSFASSYCCTKWSSSAKLTDAKIFLWSSADPCTSLLLRSRLIQPPIGKLGWRAGVITVLTWLPPVLLTMLSGGFTGGVQAPLLYDIEVHARLLCSLPLMVLAELVVYIRMRRSRCRL